MTPKELAKKLEDVFEAYADATGCGCCASPAEMAQKSVEMYELIGQVEGLEKAIQAARDVGYREGYEVGSDPPY